MNSEITSKVKESGGGKRSVETGVPHVEVESEKQNASGSVNSLLTTVTDAKDTEEMLAMEVDNDPSGDEHRVRFAEPPPKEESNAIGSEKMEEQIDEDELPIPPSEAKKWMHMDKVSYSEHVFNVITL